MLNLINLGDMYYEKKRKVSGFIYGPLSIDEMKKKKIVILGTGVNSFLCTSMLEKTGIQVASYCENFEPLVGMDLFSKKIASSYEMFRHNKDEYFFISTVDKKYAHDVCCQLFVYGIES